MTQKLTKPVLPPLQSSPKPTNMQEQITMRIGQLKAEMEKFVPEKQEEIRVLQQKIMDEQNQLNTIVGEANSYIAGLDASIKELENILKGETNV